jgi:hypothetical protein
MFEQKGMTMGRGVSTYKTETIEGTTKIVILYHDNQGTEVSRAFDNIPKARSYVEFKREDEPTFQFKIFKQTEKEIVWSDLSV